MATTNTFVPVSVQTVKCKTTYPALWKMTFCETGTTRSPGVNRFYTPSDPLLNGSGCSGRNTCCTFNNPPWFCKELPASTTDDIEVRICADQSAPNEDSPIHLIELYVK